MSSTRRFNCRQAGDLIVADHPGGSFSSGRLSDQTLPENNVAKQTVSLDALAQLHLVPSTEPSLPTTGEVGDLFLVYVEPKVKTRLAASAAQLWVCTQVLENVPYWERVQMGVATAGGTLL